jgi:prepilin-type N-terminal cleavage/methylation domain-containing protein
MKLMQKTEKRVAGQSGFTLIELLVAVAISGLLAAGVVMAISQVISVNAGSTSRMLAVKQIESVIDIIRPDVIMAKKVTPDASTTGFPLTLTRANWEESQNTIIYTFDAANSELIRDDGSVVKVIAQNIESIEMVNKSEYTSGDETKVTLIITASVGGYRPAKETRQFDIFPRPAN